MDGQLGLELLQVHAAHRLQTGHQSLSLDDLQEVQPVMP